MDVHIGARRYDREVMEETLEARLNDIVEKLAPIRPVRVVLFGSAARGQFDALSDIDLIVVAEDVPERFGDRFARVYDLVDPRFGLDVFVYTPDECRRMLADGNPLLERAEAEGRVLYERPAA